MSDEVHRGTAKGVIVRPMVEWLEANHGTSAMESVADALEPRWLAYLRKKEPALGIAHSRWYDEELADALAERIFAVADAAGGERNETLAGIGKMTVERSLSRFARAALWFVSPAMTAVSAQMFWRLHHSRGTISASVQGTTMSAVGTGWGIHGRAWCSIVGASAVQVLELAGCKAPHLERHACAGGYGSCTMTLTWTG